jgi:hypothetical protein
LSEATLAGLAPKYSTRLSEMLLFFFFARAFAPHSLLCFSCLPALLGGVRGSILNSALLYSCPKSRLAVKSQSQVLFHQRLGGPAFTLCAPISSKLLQGRFASCRKRHLRGSHPRIQSGFLNSRCLFRSGACASQYAGVFSALLGGGCDSILNSALLYIVAQHGAWLQKFTPCAFISLGSFKEVC